jgi:hypothetical protein
MGNALESAGMGDVGGSAGEPTTGRRVATFIGKALASVTALAVAAVALLFVDILSMLASWRVAAGANAVSAGFGIWLLWSYRRRSMLLQLLGGAILVPAIVWSVLLLPTWRIQARHDGRLAVLVDELCGITLPEDASLDGCGGTIFNIGNGNSCSYWANGLIRTTADRAAVVTYLEGKGYQPTELNLWGEPARDGRLYWLTDDEPDGVHVSIMNSWQPDEEDPRCQ